MVFARWRQAERRVPVFDPKEVTTQSQEVRPDVAGLRQAQVDRMWRAVERYYRAGINPALAVCVRRRGHVVIDRAIGHMSASTDGVVTANSALATPSTLYNIFSASKMVVAMLTHLMAERGLLDLSDPVAKHVPEFAAHGKADITIDEVLTHRAGVPTMNEPTTLDLLADRKRVVEVICGAPAAPLARGRVAYHALTGGYILGEVVERVAGKSLNEILQSELAQPLGWSHFRYGVEANDVERVAKHTAVGFELPWWGRALSRRALGIELDDAVRLSNDERFLTTVVPAGNLVTTPNEACAFMELLLRGGELDSHRVFSQATIERATRATSHREIDLTLGLPVRYGSGFMLGAKVLSPYGLSSERAFGHLGLSQVLLYADPDREISAAIISTGKTFLSPGLAQFIALVHTIAFSS